MLQPLKAGAWQAECAAEQHEQQPREQRARRRSEAGGGGRQRRAAAAAVAGPVGLLGALVSSPSNFPRQSRSCCSLVDCPAAVLASTASAIPIGASKACQQASAWWQVVLGGCSLGGLCAAAAGEQAWRPAAPGAW